MFIYCVIYGSDWEDIMYFGDLYKAKYKLAVQTKHAVNFVPFIREYYLKDGVYMDSRREWYITGDLSDFEYHNPTPEFVENILDANILEYKTQS
jgi:hypothetical protein